MQTVILLIIVLIAGLYFNKEKSPYSRVVIGSVFGLIFFAIWPFIVFYSEIYDLEEKQLLFAFAAISILAILITLFLVQLKNKLVVAIISFCIFISLTLFSMSYSHEIKSKLSIYTGYFDRKYSPKYKPNKTSLRKLVSTHNYHIAVDKDWQKQTDKGGFFEYYLLVKNNKKIAELRPKCFNLNKISLPELIKTMKKSTSMKVNSYCYQPVESSYACKINLLNKEEQIIRIRWYSFDTKASHGIELDFVLYVDRPSSLKEIELIIQSAKITNKNNKNQTCLGLTEWM